MSSMVSWNDLLARFDALEGRVPDTEEYQAFCSLVTEHPMAAGLARLDPFSAEYRRAAMDLYLDLRGRADTTQGKRMKSDYRAATVLKV